MRASLLALIAAPFMFVPATSPSPRLLLVAHHERCVDMQKVRRMVDVYDGKCPLPDEDVEIELRTKGDELPRVIIYYMKDGYMVRRQQFRLENVRHVHIAIGETTSR